jgi:hypothetical protein
MKSILFAICLGLALSKTQILREDLSIEWNILDSNTVSFSIHVGEDLYRDDRYIGIGLKSASLYSGMYQSDIVIFSMGDLFPCTDSFVVQNATYPSTDDVQSIQCQPTVQNDDEYVYTWTRPITASSSQDYDLSQSNDLRFIWAFGEINEDTGLLGFHGKNAGTAVVQIVDADSSFLEVEAPEFLGLISIDNN